MRIALVGPSASGKTTLLRTYTRNAHPPVPTVGVEMTTIRHNNRTIDVWDTGSRRFMVLTRQICQDVDRVVLVYDPRRDPFSLAEFFGLHKRILLVANIAHACDYPPEDVAAYLNCPYMYVDVTDRDDVRALFDTFAPLPCCF